MSSGDSEDDMDAFSENSEDSLDALGADFESEGDEGADRIPTALITPQIDSTPSWAWLHAVLCCFAQNALIIHP